MNGFEVCGHLRVNIDNIERQIKYWQDKLDTADVDEKPEILATIRELKEKRKLAVREYAECLTRKSNLEIASIEFTQSIQFFLFNGQGSGAGRDNSIPLVELKPTIVRVYVNQTTQPEFPIPVQVSGSLEYAGNKLSPFNAPINPIPSGAINRGNVNHTLNFRIPAHHCKNQLSMDLTVFDPTRQGDPAFASRPINFFSPWFEKFPPLHAHGVLIRYVYQGRIFPAPATEDMLTTMGFAVRVYPIPWIEFDGFTEIEFRGDLTQVGGGCGAGWDELIGILNAMRVASGYKSIYIGLLPAAIAGISGLTASGCGGGGAAAAISGRGQTMAQEVAHFFGLQHAPCGNPPNVDPNFPTYGSSPAGSIGEFGFDHIAFGVLNPSSTFDYMSYCGPVWTSPYTYVKLMNAIRARTAIAHADRPQVLDVIKERLYLRFCMRRDGKVELLSSFHLPGSAPSMYQHEPAHMLESHRGPSISCELRGREGEIIEVHRCHLSDPHQDPKATSLVVEEVVPWGPGIHSIAFFRDGQEVDVLSCVGEPPEASIKAPKFAREPEGVALLEWTATHAESERIVSLLRYSHDGGTTWQTLAVGLTETQFTVNFDYLPGGDNSVFQVVASAGVRTTVAETKPFSVPRKPRRAYILAPAPDAAFEAGESVRMHGGAFSPDFGMADPEEVLWTSNLTGVIGTGHEIVTHTLPVGRHRITMKIPDGLGEETSAGVYIQVKSNQ